MPTLEIPLSTDVWRNVDEEALNERSSYLIDGYLERAGEQLLTKRRPGLGLFVDLGISNSPVDGIYWWDQAKIAIAVAGGRTFKITYPSGTPTVTELTGTTKMTSGAHVNFATDGTYVFMVNGGQVFYTNGVALTQVVSQAPVLCSDIAYLDGYLLVNNRFTNRFSWSNVNDSFTWNALNFASASGNPDFVDSLRVGSREILLFGKLSVEIWENDGINPFSRVPGGYLETGISAPNSIINHDGQWYWLDDERNFVTLEGRRPTEIPTIYDKVIYEFSTVADCLGEHIKINGKSFLVFHFPTADRTLVYNLITKDWSEWGKWNTNTSSYNRFLGNCYTHAKDWNQHLIGSRRDSKIYSMSFSYYDDAGEQMRFQRRSGHYDHGVMKEKRSNELRWRMKRGIGLNSRTPKAMLRWKDSNKNTWSNEHEMNLGDQGETELIFRLRRLGIFQTRQYEVSVTDAVPVCLIKAEEDYDVLR